MSIYSYVLARIEDGGRTGVPRFDAGLRTAIPGLISVNKSSFPKLCSEDMVITDNHLSMDVPEDIRTIAVHHGCAAIHYARDLYWHTEHTATIAMLQDEMFRKQNRVFVAPSAWVAEAFREWHEPADYKPAVIPHWVDQIQRNPINRIKQQIIGDWRDRNKGSDVWQKIAQYCPQYEFRPLNFKNDDERLRIYGEADLYLCLSLSEGAVIRCAMRRRRNCPLSLQMSATTGNSTIAK